MHMACVKLAPVVTAHAWSPHRIPVVIGSDGGSHPAQFAVSRSASCLPPCELHRGPGFCVPSPVLVV
jgi:hypothetical protein